MPYSVFPTGVTLYDPSRSWNGYVLFGSPDGTTHLIDMNGNEVHTWPFLGFPSESLAPDRANGKRGHILVQLSSTELGPWSGIFNNKTMNTKDYGLNKLWGGCPHPPGRARCPSHKKYTLFNSCS